MNTLERYYNIQNKLKKLNETLNEMKADGTFGRISEKWFGKEEN